MSLRCAICSRPLLRPKVTLGAMNVGPKCAVRAGLIERKARTPIHDRPTVIRDKYTRDWVKELAA